MYADALVLTSASISGLQQLLDICDAASQPLYMGCSDVSEFEHIYGQIVTTPSCVYTMHSLHEQE